MEKRTKKLKLNLVLDKEQIEFIDQIPKNTCSSYRKRKKPLCRLMVIRIILNWAKNNGEVDVSGVKTEKELVERFLNGLEIKTPL